MKIKRGVNNITINIISEQKSFSKGNAFGETIKAHLMNTPAETMGIDIINPIDYSIWYKEKYGKIIKYTKRYQYSEYLTDKYNYIKQNTSFNINEFKTIAEEIEIKDNKIFIKTIDNHTVDSDYLIYSPGHIMSDNYNFSNKNFIKNPYIFDYNRIKNNNSIGILGSGLTSVDVIRNLIDKGFKGRINLYSRNGNLPTVINPESKYIPTIFTYENIVKDIYSQTNIKIKDIMKLLYNEMKLINNEYIKSKTLARRNQMQYFKYLYSRSLHMDLPLQDTLVSTRHYITKVWNLLDHQSKIYFNQHLASDWNTYRHPIPQESFKHLMLLSKTKQIKYHILKNKSIVDNKSYYLNTNNGIIKENILIDGTGGNLNVNENKDLFLNSLLKNNFAYPCRFGGLKVSPIDFRLINKKTKNIFLIGQFAKGSLFSTNAFWFNAHSANIVANNLLNEFLI